MKNNLQKKIKRTLKGLILVISFLTLALSFLVFLEVRDKVRLVSPPATPLFEDRYGSFLSEGTGNENDSLGFWEVPEPFASLEGRPLPERIVSCLLAIEDKRFYEHKGVDFRSLLRAMYNNFTGGKRQGASTIAMQVVRMQNPTQRTYWKKTCELVTARLLIRKFGHKKVLRQYLKIVPQGNRIHGVSYAARRYFQKPTQDLSWTEAAVLASLPRAPGSMNLYRLDGRQKAYARAELILDLLHKNGTLDEETYTISRRQLMRLKIPFKESRPFHSYHAILRLEEAFRQEKRALLASGFNHKKPLVQSPITRSLRGTEQPQSPITNHQSPITNYTSPIRTSFDLYIQDKVDQLADEAIKRYRPLGAGNIAVIVAEKETGQILSYVGSNFYHDEKSAGAINYATTPRSAGSTLKPFIYALGFATGKFSPASILSDQPFQISYPGGHYSVSNYDEHYLGPLLYRKALANSRNIPAVHVLRTVGLENTYDLFRRVGLTKSDKIASYYGLGLAIGGLYVTLEELVTAYGVLANDGEAFVLRWFKKGDFVFRRINSTENKEEIPEQFIPEDIARQITLFLADPLARLPSFPRMGALEYPFPVAVKTGTSHGFRDAWAVAYSSKYIIGAWIGHPDNERMKQVSGIAAARLVKKIMLFLHPVESRGIDEKPFPTPEGYKAVKLCPLSGELVTEDCSEIVLEYFRPGTEPAIPSRVHQRFAVDKRTGELASPLTPPDQVEVRSYVVLPPKFAAWGAKYGYGKPPSPSSESLETSIAIQEPVHGSVFMFNPETPKHLQTIALRASITPVVEKIIWYVDGKPFKEVPYPYIARWPLSSGVHTMQARFPYANVTSDIITITISH